MGLSISRKFFTNCRSLKLLHLVCEYLHKKNHKSTLNYYKMRVFKLYKPKYLKNMGSIRSAFWKRWKDDKFNSYQFSALSFEISQQNIKIRFPHSLTKILKLYLYISTTYFLFSYCLVTNQVVWLLEQSILHCWKHLILGFPILSHEKERHV